MAMLVAILEAMLDKDGDSIGNINTIISLGSTILVALITYKAATYVYKMSKKEKQLEYQSQIHMILKEMGSRIRLLGKVKDEIEELKNELFENNQMLSSEKGIYFIYNFYNMIRKIKPDGGFEHFKEFEIT